MTIYIIAFLISILFIYWAERYNERDIRFLLCSFVAILIPCVVAGLRDISIGTDVKVYAEPMLKIAKDTNSFQEFYHTTWYMAYVRKSISDIELGYDLLVYITAKFFGSVQVLLFFTSILIIVPIYKSLLNIRNKIPIWLGMTVFYLMFYNTSLNIMRQFIAMAFMLLAFSELFNGRKGKFYAYSIVALLFHMSALLIIVLYVLYRYLTASKLMDMERNANRKTILVFFIGIGTLIFYQVISRLLERFGLAIYTRYLLNGLMFLPLQIILRIPFLFLALVYWRVLKKDSTSLFCVGIILLDTIYSQLAGMESQTIRISMYFAMFRVIFVPVVFSKLSVMGKRTIFVFILLYMCVYWGYFFVYRGIAETYPYQFYFS